MKNRQAKRFRFDELPEYIEPEKFTDSEDLDVENHIPVLLETIGSLKLEKIDLSSADSAYDAVNMLNQVIDKLSTFKNAATTLRQILESDNPATKKH